MADEGPAIFIVFILTCVLWSPVLDSGHDAGIVPECHFISAQVTDKVYPIPGTEDVYGIVVLVDDEAGGDFTGEYGIIVEEHLYDTYYVGDTFTQFVCSNEEYEKLKEFLHGLINIDLFTPGNNYGY